MKFKSTYNLCTYNRFTNEILKETICLGDIKHVLKYIKNLKKEYGEDIQIKAGYEAGCLGCVPYKQLTIKGIDCDILASTTMYRSSKNRLNKNNKLDARNIALNFTNGTSKFVYELNEDDQAVKEYIGMLDDTKIAREKVKQQINAFTLRNGFKYPDKSKWALAHIKWLRELELSPLLKETLNKRLAQYDSLCDKI